MRNNARRDLFPRESKPLANVGNNFYRLKLEIGNTNKEFNIIHTYILNDYTYIYLNARNFVERKIRLWKFRRKENFSIGNSSNSFCL